MRIPLRIPTMKIRFALPLLVAAALATGTTGCSDALEVGDLNNVPLDSLRSANPNPATVNAAALGLLVGTRTQMGAQNGFISLLGILGRESYNFDPSDPRFITEMLGGPLNGGSPAFGGNLFGNPYANIRVANLILEAVPKTTGYSGAQQEAVRGFVKTIEAYDLLQVAVTRAGFGAPIDVNIEPTAAPAPIVGEEEVYARVFTLLDEAQGHLQAGGGAFPFALPSGFDGFDTPSTFIAFNRALRARTSVYRDRWAEALAALGQSFVDTTAPLTLGVYHTYSTRSGDIQNNLFDPSGRAIFAHPSIITDAQPRAGGGIDLRATSKVDSVEQRTVQGVSSNLIFTVYAGNTAPIPVIRNEELILLRAEANLGLNNLTDALADINHVRRVSGGLPPYAGPVTHDDLLQELLYNKRYSLLFEWGHRWIDLRHYGLLGTLPKADPGHRVFDRFPFPIGECDARLPDVPAGCGQVNGI
jgi:starch-binding outer membrane protein, SusD/RagB family